MWGGEGRPLWAKLAEGLVLLWDRGMAREVRLDKDKSAAVWHTLCVREMHPGAQLVEEAAEILSLCDPGQLGEQLGLDLWWETLHHQGSLFLNVSFI